MKIIALLPLGIALALTASATSADTIKKRGLDRLVAAQQASPSSDFNAFLDTAAKADPTLQQRAATDFRVVQGAVEKSNVQSVLEMTRMIEVSRSYTEVANIVQQQSELRRDVISRLADVPV